MKNLRGLFSDDAWKAVCNLGQDIKVIGSWLGWLVYFTRDRAEGGAGGASAAPTFLQE